MPSPLSPPGPHLHPGWWQNRQRSLRLTQSVSFVPFGRNKEAEKREETHRRAAGKVQQPNRAAFGGPKCQSRRQRPGFTASLPASPASWDAGVRMGYAEHEERAGEQRVPGTATLTSLFQHHPPAGGAVHSRRGKADSNHAPQTALPGTASAPSPLHLRCRELIWANSTR